MPEGFADHVMASCREKSRQDCNRKAERLTGCCPGTLERTGRRLVIPSPSRPAPKNIKNRLEVAHGYEWGCRFPGCALEVPGQVYGGNAA